MTTSAPRSCDRCPRAPNAANAAIASNALCATPLGRCARPSQSTHTNSVPAERERAARFARSKRAPNRGRIGDDEIVFVNEPGDERYQGRKCREARERVVDAARDRASAAAIARTATAASTNLRPFGRRSEAARDRERGNLDCRESLREAVRGDDAGVRERPRRSRSRANRSRK